MFDSKLNLKDPKIKSVNKKYGKDAASLWKISNACARLFSLFVFLGIMLLLLSGLARLDAMATIGLLLVAISALFFAAYYLSVLLLSILMKDYFWAILILTLSFPLMLFKPLKKL